MNVDLPFVDSLPLVFAINQGTHKAVYFSARESGYDEVKLFSDIQVLQIQAVLHKSTNEFDQEKYHVGKRAVNKTTISDRLTDNFGWEIQMYMPSTHPVISFTWLPSHLMTFPFVRMVIARRVILPLY
jgi:hypothetical protein